MDTAETTSGDGPLATPGQVTGTVTRLLLAELDFRILIKDHVLLLRWVVDVLITLATRVRFKVLL